MQPRACHVSVVDVRVCVFTAEKPICNGHQVPHLCGRGIFQQSIPPFNLLSRLYIQCCLLTKDCAYNMKKLTGQTLTNRCFLGSIKSSKPWHNMKKVTEQILTKQMLHGFHQSSRSHGTLCTPILCARLKPKSAQLVMMFLVGYTHTHDSSVQKLKIISLRILIASPHLKCHTGKLPLRAGFTCAS